MQEVKVTVPESVEIMVLWQGREAGNSFTLTATVEPGKEYHWPGGPQGLQIKDLSNVPIDLYKGLKETSRAQKPYPYKTSNTPTTASDSPKHH
ncbi:conserved hypothetical protein [Methanothermobacter sp. CaT2]|nr:conserved hypothetical protein [Methanothermobacter sp. CaT2]